MGNGCAPTDPTCVDLERPIFCPTSSSAGNSVIRAYDLVSAGISTVAGTGTPGCGADGDIATLTQLNRPDGLAYDSTNSILYFSEPTCYRVRAIPFSTTRVVSTVAGTGTAGFSGDGLPGTASMLSAPRGLCLDTSLDLYITGAERTALVFFNPAPRPHTTLQTLQMLESSYSTALRTRCRRVSNGMLYSALNFPSIPPHASIAGPISADIGNGSVGYGSEGILGRASPMAGPVACCIGTNSAGASDMFVVDGNRVRLLTRSTLTLSTVAGTAASGFSGDGFAATASLLSNPLGVALAVSSVQRRSLSLLSADVRIYVAGMSCHS